MTCRSKLLRNNQKRTSVQHRSPYVGHYGFNRIRLPYGQHGSSSLRDVQHIRQRFISYSSRPRSGIWQAFPRRTKHIGSNFTMLSHTQVYTWSFAQVTYIILYRYSYYIQLTRSMAWLSYLIGKTITVKTIPYCTWAPVHMSPSLGIDELNNLS